MIDRSSVHEGMAVRSSDGKKLGAVMACRKESFVVEKGAFFATDYLVPYDDVTEISGDEIRISRAQEALAHAQHAFLREGGLGESFTLGMASGPDISPRKPWEVAEEEEEEAGGTSPHGDEEGGAKVH